MGPMSAACVASVTQCQVAGGWKSLTAFPNFYDYHSQMDLVIFSTIKLHVKSATMEPISTGHEITQTVRVPRVDRSTGRCGSFENE